MTFLIESTLISQSSPLPENRWGDLSSKKNSSSIFCSGNEISQMKMSQDNFTENYVDDVACLGFHENFIYSRFSKYSFINCQCLEADLQDFIPSLIVLNKILDQFSDCIFIFCSFSNDSIPQDIAAFEILNESKLSHF
jgi:hypothetical protein